MFLTVERTNENSSLEKVQFLLGERCVLHFSQDGKEFSSFSLTPKILHKILVDDQEARNLVNDPDIKYRPLNGHSYLVESPEEE